MLQLLDPELLREVILLAAPHPPFNNHRRRLHSWCRFLELVVRPLARAFGRLVVTPDINLSVADAAAFEVCVRRYGSVEAAKERLRRTQNANTWVALVARGHWSYSFDKSKSNAKYELAEGGRLVTVKIEHFGMPACIATAKGVADGGVLQGAGRHYFELEVVEDGEEKDGAGMLGVCRPDTDYNTDEFYEQPGTWLIYHQHRHWDTHVGGKTTDISSLMACGSQSFPKGSRRGILVDLGRGTMSIVSNGKVVCGDVMTGITGPVLPCLSLCDEGTSVRLHGELDVPAGC